MAAKDTDSVWCFVCIFFAVLVACVGTPLKWHRAGLQAEAYHRRNIEISQWEIFTGVNPAEKAIQIRE